MTTIAIAAVTVLVSSYLALLLALLVARPEGSVLAEARRIVPDVLRFLSRLGRSTALPRCVRVALWALLLYLALPFDLVPDVIPVLGYADDVILISIVLRWVLQRAGRDKVTELWPGTPDGLRALGRLTRLELSAPSRASAAARTAAGA